LLRAVARELLPSSVIDRVKSAYPSISVPSYFEVLKDQASELTTDKCNSVFAIVNRSWLNDVAQRDARAMPARIRNSLEWILNLAAWLDVYRPKLQLP
jgi:asparagine synthase (glutamine-hydrolysing)